ncbi:MAG: helix-turn-helix domain-containing protein [Gordonia sp. (in: high G+C Gram-positive bacteria)]|uniref:PucR family transcriptional regulator n=1 Tax=Gordonia sp. (in: high G+C Gram-positive bacteria) TaxID=84139 RepID=UPI003C70FCB1
MASMLVDLARRLRDEAPVLSVVAADAIRQELPEYKSVPADELRASTLRNALRGAQCLEDGRLPADSDEANEPVETTSLRTAQGLRIDTIIRGYRVSLNAVHSRFIVLADEMDLDPKEMLAGSTLLWSLGDWFVNRSVAEYRARTVDAAVQRSIEKAQVVHALIDGSRPGEELLRRAAALGLRSGGEYRVVFGGSESLPVQEWVRRLERYGADAHGAAIATASALGVVALVARVPVEAAVDHPLAMGPVAPLTDLRRSVEIAERILAGLDLSRPGVHSLETVTWRAGVSGLPELDDVLRARYVEPLRGEAGFADVLLDSAWAYLVAARNVRVAAKRLTIHENSLRYRVARFEALTGRDLGEVDTVVELAWLRQVLDSAAIRGWTRE